MINKSTSNICTSNQQSSAASIDQIKQEIKPQESQEQLESTIQQPEQDTEMVFEESAEESDESPESHHSTI